MYELTRIGLYGYPTETRNGLESREAFATAAHMERWELRNADGKLAAKGKRQKIDLCAPWIEVPEFMEH